MAPNESCPDTCFYVISSFVWHDIAELEGLQQAEVWTSLAAATAAAKAMMNRYAEKLNPLGDMDEWDFNHKEDPNGFYYGELDGGPGGHVAATIRISRVALNAANMMRDEEKSTVKGEVEQNVKKEECVEDEKKPAPKKKTTPPKTAINPQTHRKTIPVGKPNCLEGLKIIFTGTFETMDRKTSVATAIKYGAEVITKLEDTDYIVIGLRAGPKKLQEINEKELETISEEEFFQILENGLSEEKKERMAARRAADASEEADPDADGGKKRAAASSRRPGNKKKTKR